MSNQTTIQEEPTEETMESINYLFNEAIQYFDREEFWDMFQDSLAGITSMNRDAKEMHNRAYFYRILEKLFDKIQTVPRANFAVLSVRYKGT